MEIGEDGIRIKLSLKEIKNNLPEEYRKLFIKNELNIEIFNSKKKVKTFRGKLDIDELYCFYSSYAQKEGADYHKNHILAKLIKKMYNE